MECQTCPDLKDKIWNLNNEIMRLNKEFRNVIANMKSNHDSHAGYIKQLEKVLDHKE